MAPSDFRNFFEVATGHCKNAAIRVGAHFVSSLFSLLSALWFCLRSFDPALAAEQIDCIFTMDYVAPSLSTPQICSRSSPAGWCRNSAGPPKETPFWTSEGFALLSSLFSLLSSPCRFLLFLAYFPLLFSDFASGPRPHFRLILYSIASRIPPGHG